ncbi:MAG TPA: hypothetical protein DCS33_11955 [Gammaproteobacteria bacterium]|nr:hypothetical protein [Gammaproteobacteria bacterium]
MQSKWLVLLLSTLFLSLSLAQTNLCVDGAPNAGLSWPGRCSHSPAETAELGDVAKLIDLIQAMAEAPQGP